MRKIKAVVSAWLVVCLLVGNVQAAIWFAASPEWADVNEAVASAAVGDEVIIPAGTASWTQTLRITKAITLRGSGMGQTILLDDIPAGSSQHNQHMIYWSTQANTTNRVTGITFRRGARTAELVYGTIALWGNSWMVRIDNCEFDRILNRPLCVNGAVYGVMDHCKLYYTEGQTAMVEHGSAYGKTWGDGSWETPVIPGSGEAFYFEDNNIIGKATDAVNGARIVFRFNTITNTGTTSSFGTHGTESSQRKRAARWMEVYGNRVYKVSGTLHAFVDFRDGSGIVCSNIVTGNVSHGILLNNYRNRDKFTPWGGADGTNPWDVNYPDTFDSGTATGSATRSMTDSTKSWTPNQWVGYALRNLATGRFSRINGNTASTITYEAGQNSSMTFAVGEAYDIRRVDIALDQPGSGRSDPISTASPGWPNQERQPIYQWANTKNGVPMTFSVAGINMVLGRDYFSETPNPDFVPYQYPHPVIGITEGTGGLPDPTISAHPQSQTISSGSTATISVTASGTAPFTYQWYLGASGNTANPVSGATSSSYTTPALTETAVYWCRVSNANGFANSVAATITVSGSAPTINTQPQDQSIYPNQSASLSVIASGTGTLSYQWYVGSSGNTSSPVSGATSSDYSPSPSSTTTYWCRVSNSFGSVDSSAATVTVLPPPAGGKRNPKSEAIWKRRG